VSIFNKSDNSVLKDEDLITKYRFSHDNTYLGELYLRYLPYVYGVALNQLKSQTEAEELSMTVFNKISSDLKRIEVRQFSDWLYKLVLDLCNIEVRKKTAGKGESKQILIEELSDEKNDLYINTEDGVKLDSNSLRLAINTLNESQKICIDLFYIQNRSYKEVAETTGYTINQVKTNIQNGKRLLKSYLEIKGN
jgi:RNA polymerase sigma-70 factor (ECF subfamily)